MRLPQAQRPPQTAIVDLLVIAVLYLETASVGGLFQMREQVCVEAARVACLSYREPGTGSILKWDLA